MNLRDWLIARLEQTEDNNAELTRQLAERDAEIERLRAALDDCIAARTGGVMSVTQGSDCCACDGTGRRDEVCVNCNGTGCSYHYQGAAAGCRQCERVAARAGGEERDGE